MRFYPGLLRYPDDFFNGLNQTEVIFADMPHRYPVVLSDNLTYFGQLFRIGVAAREVIKTGGKPNRPLAHSLCHQCLHLGQFFSGGGTVDKAHCLQPKRVVRHEVSHVDCHLAVKPGKVITHRIPVPGNIWVTVQAGKIAPHHLQIDGG
ncbi:hypothetical protein ES703_64779 [subsurface metagenome]